MTKGASRRVLRNLGVVLRGQGIAAVFTLLATVLMANALPVEEFGLVILLHTYVLAVRGALNFRTYEAIVRFGVPLHENGENEGLKQLFHTTTLIDLLSGVLATVVGVSAASLAGGMLHWDEHTIKLASLYALVMLTTVSNTPNGVLRLYDRFDALSIFYIVGPAVRIMGVSIAWAVDAGMEVYIAIWAAAFVLENSWLFVRGHMELKTHLGGRFWKDMSWRGGNWQEINQTPREFRHFMAVLYWQTNIDLLPKHMAVLLAGSLLGPAAAGMFRLARDVSSLLTKPAMMLREVLFPDLTRIAHNEAEGFFELGYRAVKTASVAGLILVLLSIPGAGPLLSIVGPEYTQASTLMTLLLLAATFELASSPLRAAAYAIGRVAPVLRIHFLGIVIYFAGFYLLAPVMGLSGAGIAACAGTLMTLLLMLKLVKKPQ
jgi:O-antigen/teichoic acid export membrane protein